jgi:hypothetical protein
MKQNLRKVTLAASAFVFAGLFSFGGRGAPPKLAGRLRIRRGGRCRHRGRGRHGGRYRRHLALLHRWRLGVALTTVVLFGSQGGLLWWFPIGSGHPWWQPTSLRGAGLLRGRPLVRLQRVG